MVTVDKVLALPDFSGVEILKDYLETASADETVLFCKDLFQEHKEELHYKFVFPCMSALEKIKTQDAYGLIAWCVNNNIQPSNAAHTLMKMLEFPPVGEATKIAEQLNRNFSKESAAGFLKLIGVDTKTHRFDVRNSTAYRGNVFTDKDKIMASPEKVVAVDLAFGKYRELPTFLKKCTNLKYLNIDDDYFSADGMKKFEAQLPGVSVRWTRGLYVDGKHGR